MSKTRDKCQNSKNSDISIIRALAVTLALKKAPKSFHVTPWLMMMHHQIKFGYKMFSNSKGIVMTKSRTQTSDSNISQYCSAAAHSAHRPAACQQNLPIHLHRGAATKLSSCQVGVVRGVDKVVTKWLVHVHVDIQTVQKHRSILIRHQVTTKSIHAQPLWKNTQV